MWEDFKERYRPAASVNLKSCISCSKSVIPWGQNKQWEVRVVDTGILLSTQKVQTMHQDFSSVTDPLTGKASSLMFLFSYQERRDVLFGSK